MLFGLVWFLAALFQVSVLSRVGGWGGGGGWLKSKIQLSSAWLGLSFAIQVFAIILLEFSFNISVFSGKPGDARWADGGAICAEHLQSEEMLSTVTRKCYLKYEICICLTMNTLPCLLSWYN